MKRLARAGVRGSIRAPLGRLPAISRVARAGVLALGISACAAAPSGQSHTSVLLSSPELPAPVAGAADAESEPGRNAGTGPFALPFRGPGPDGAAYRLVLELSGERALSLSTDLEDRRPLHESHLLELEYQALPVKTASGGQRAYQLSLDGLHYRLLQKNPTAEREIELGNDRLRVTSNGKVELDLRGAQPKENLTPRTLLGRIFAIVAHDAVGDPLRIQPRGTPAARGFLKAFQVTPAIRYSRLPLAVGEIEVGATWHSTRFPASPAGEIGLRLDVEYTLAGFREWEGVPCAWILFSAGENAEGVPSAAGFEFERVAATLAGEAWVELATSRLRRLVLDDEIRASYSEGAAPGPIANHRLRHKTRLLLTLRDPDETPSKWEDGSERFGRR